MTTKTNSKAWRSTGGFSILELVTVVTISAILTALAVPQMMSQRRLTRSTAVTREISTEMRYTRQMAMSQRRAYTLQYDDTAKTLKVIGPIPAGVAGLTDGSYPTNTGSSVVATFPLIAGGVPATEISYGIPTTSTGLPSGAPTIPTTALTDGVVKTDLINSKLNITFQPDGSVIDTSGNPLDRGMFIFNNKAAQGTASAITVLGVSGRIKIWRYTLSANNYQE
jgi:Tfp pilus assembly protein FimT